MRKTKETATADEAITTALAVMVWILSDDDRANRLLSLTGMTPEGLRSRATEPTLLVAMLNFLEGHEPDLIACAQDLELSPDQLVATRMLLER